jgi:hypothetical protein
MLFACEMCALVAEKAVIKWDRSSRGDLRYLNSLYGVLRTVDSKVESGCG